MEQGAERHRIVDFLGIPLTAISTEDFTATVIARARARQRTRITYINAMCVNTAAETPDYLQTLRTAELVYADGQAIVWAARRLGDGVPERVNAGDFFPAFFQRCTEENLSVFFLGSPPGVAERAAARLCELAPGLRVAGTHHGFLSGASTPQVIARINGSEPSLLIVGMGVPHQERWLWANWDALAVPVAWCVGATLDYYAGEFPRAPVWMRRCGLEWLFRLVLEPRRLWRRYLLGNPRFVWRVMRRRRLGE
ncbi:WecB/TagA/CpsF family glycosyltransferase [Candidatus Sumerlaeota bacterium]|nr:WecB/TagA/CpsF family glycosyltransferase [Candidatus Sumerlaeota bacterium]